MAWPKLAFETRIILIVGSIQFINILDFMMVMPLGPDLSAALGIPMAGVGVLAAAYSGAAAVSGLLSSLFLDRFDRRAALAVALSGLVAGGFLSSLAVDAATLIAARVLAGAFGGPATALAMAVIADTIAPERRGRAVGAVMSAFSVASVAGVPIGLELARLGGWWLPFVVMGASGAVVCALALAWLPPLAGHVAAARATKGVFARWRALGRGTLWAAFGCTALMTVSMFALIPSIAPHLLTNLDFPREELGLLYMAGGAVTFVTIRIAGRAVDRFGSGRTVAAVSVGIVMVNLSWFVLAPPVMVPIYATFVGFMLFNSARNVAIQSVNSRAPRAAERAGFLALDTTTRHVSVGTGAFVASLLLSEGAGGALVGIDRIAWASIGATLLLVPLVMAVERRVRREEVTGP